MPPTTLADVLAPTPLDQFLSAVWGKQCVHIKGTPGRFAELLPWDAMNALVQRHILKPLDMRLVKDGQGVPATEYLKTATTVIGDIQQIRAQEFTKQLRDGASIVFDHVQEHYDAVARLAESFEFTLHEPVNVNSYIGFRTTKGFDLHWDGHDVFILQVAGRKKWTVYGQDEKHPLKGGGKPGTPPPTEPVWEGILEDGDVLYFPRGWWHVAYPLDEPSLHLTVGVRPRTGIDLLGYLTEGLKESELFRAPLPRFVSATERAERVAQLREELIARYSADVIDRFFVDCDAKAGGTPMMSLPWTALPELVLPADDAVLQLTAPRSVRLEARADDAPIQFVANGRRWRFAAGAVPMISRILEGQPVSIAELCEVASATMSRDQVRRLLTKMISQGLVAVVKASAVVPVVQAPAVQAPAVSAPAGQPAAADASEAFAVHA